MDPPGGKGGKRRLGMTRPPPPPRSSPAPSAAPPPPPAPSAVAPPSQAPISDPAAPAPTPTASTPATAAPSSSPAVPPRPAQGGGWGAIPAAPSSSPSAPTSFPAVPPQTAQGGGWGAIPPNFSLHGNQQGPNSWLYPPGGFDNFLQRPHYPLPPYVQGENFHLVGQTMNFSPISPPPPSAPPEATVQGTSTNNTVNIEGDEADNNDANRRAKKRYWTHEEEERLASAWLNASKDPIKGIDQKGDTFWNHVTDVFNKKGNGKRTRESNQLKIHWTRLKASITEFNGFWTKVTKINTSGYDNDMLEAEAQKMYANKHGKTFPLVHWWKILKDEPKWCAQFEKAEAQKLESNKSDIVDVPDEQSRPIGRDAAKAERNGKRKKGDVMEGIVILGDNIEKIVKVQQDRKVEREKMTEAQIQIAETNHKAAKEQKEAKLLEIYNSLITQDTSLMSEVQKVGREKTIRKIEEKLFGA